MPQQLYHFLSMVKNAILRLPFAKEHKILTQVENDKQNSWTMLTNVVSSTTLYSLSSRLFGFLRSSKQSSSEDLEAQAGIADRQDEPPANRSLSHSATNSLSSDSLKSHGSSSYTSAGPSIPEGEDFTYYSDVDLASDYSEVTASEISISYSCASDLQDPANLFDDEFNFNDNCVGTYREADSRIRDWLGIEDGSSTVRNFQGEAISQYRMRTHGITRGDQAFPEEVVDAMDKNIAFRSLSDKLHSERELRISGQERKETHEHYTGVLKEIRSTWQEIDVAQQRKDDNVL